jgi:glycosyltransferase involved in cell wall biosynthesis
MTASRKKILWLCSWYPSRIDPFNGDFIQRHARAAALYNDIHVIHATGVPGKAFSPAEEWNMDSPGLTEHILYYSQSASVFGKITGYFRWAAAFGKAVRRYESEYGRPDLVHVQVPVRAGLFALRLKKKWKVPFVVTEHWTIYQPSSSVQYEKQSTVFRFITRSVIRQSSLLLPVSNDLGKLMNRKVAPKEFRVVNNVANRDHFYYREPKAASPLFRFLHVSNMSEQKNVPEIIACFKEFQKKFPDTELVLAGPFTPVIKAAADTRGLPGNKIVLRGEISYEAVAAEMQRAQALVMFSSYENSPCSIIEALCCGLPVIATRVGGIPELLDDENSLLIDSGDRAGLIKAFEKMLAGYAVYNRKKIAEDAAGKFSYSVIGREMDEIYRAILSSS